MNDDITTREVELVAAILNDLYRRCLEIKTSDLKSGTYMDGYIDAIEHVNDVLDERGFDNYLPKRRYSEE